MINESWKTDKHCCLHTTHWLHNYVSNASATDSRSLQAQKSGFIHLNFQQFRKELNGALTNILCSYMKTLYNHSTGIAYVFEILDFVNVRIQMLKSISIQHASFMTAA